MCQLVPWRARKNYLGVSFLFIFMPETKTPKFLSDFPCFFFDFACKKNKIGKIGKNRRVIFLFFWFRMHKKKTDA